MAKKHYFITSSGTEIGKTFITAALVHQLRTSGQSVVAHKPIVSGFDPHDETTDPAILAQAMGQEPTAAMTRTISPLHFKEPLSPNMAAMREGRSLRLEQVVHTTQHMVQASDAYWQLIEGVGGVMVPLNQQHTVLDWMQALGMPLILVVGSYLGSISHSLTAYQAVKLCGLEVQLVVASASHTQPVPLQETVETMQDFIKEPVVGVERVPEKPRPWELVPDLLAYL